MDNERLAKAIVGRQQFLLEADAAAEVDGPRNVGDEVVGRVFDQPAVALGRLQHPAETIARFEQHDVASRIKFTQPKRCRQTRNAAADHGDAVRAVVGGRSWRHDLHRRKNKRSPRACGDRTYFH